MVQQGQVFELETCGRDGERLWAYRFRVGGRGSKRVQRGGFVSEQDAREGLERELERVRRERRIPRSLTLSELAETYLAQHDVQQVTIDKLRWLLAKATAVFGERRGRGADLAGDRRLADGALTWPPLRGDRRFAAGAAARGRLGNDRQQPRQGRRRQPGAAAEGAAAVRVMGRARGDR
jgi:hypothetical protein